MSLNTKLRPFIDTHVLIVRAGFSGAVIAERIVNGGKF